MVLDDELTACDSRGISLSTTTRTTPSHGQSDDPLSTTESVTMFRAITGQVALKSAENPHVETGNLRPAHQRL